MRKDILWDKKIESTLKSFSYQQIDDFLKSIEYAFSYDAITYIDENQYDDIDLWGWLCSHEDEELNDSKRELQKWLSKSEKITTEQFDNKINTIGRNTSIKVLIAGSSEDMFGFQTMKEYFYVIRKYLSMEKKDDFENDLEECFPNLFFVDSINSSINSLNRNFDEIREEIVLHLSELDAYKDKFARMLIEGKSNKEISIAFKGDTDIDCSTQADRDGIKELKVTLYNDLLKEKEEIVCELHTKFAKFNIDRTKQDRIYFSPGKPGIKSGRVIIKHIGTHL